METHCFHHFSRFECEQYWKRRHYTLVCNENLASVQLIYSDNNFPLLLSKRLHKITSTLCKPFEYFYVVIESGSFYRKYFTQAIQDMVLDIFLS